MKILVNFFKFWYHFIVGDDWRIAATVIVGFTIIDLLTHHNPTIKIWWLVPLLVTIILTLSFLSVARNMKK